jgi:SAM-dependent methyltransferase
MLPDASHDDRARFDTIAHLQRFLSGRVLPVVAEAYQTRATRAYRARHGHAPENREEAFHALAADPAYVAWSSLRRHLMEGRQQAGRFVALRAAGELAARARSLSAGSTTLRLDAAVRMPRYLVAVDAHCMPGGYGEEHASGDVAAAANYDAGIYATTGGAMGPYCDGAGRAIVAWLRERQPAGWSPRRIIDLGCGIGHNTLPVAAAYPDAEMIAIDVAAPMLRYGHARAQSLGARDVVFQQADATATPLEAGSADLVFTSMVLHETSREAVPALFRECARLLRSGGITLHLEQPPYRGLTPFEQAMRDWDGRYNNEPFWSGLHALDLPTMLARSGFAREHVFESSCVAPPVSDASRAGGAERAEQEDYGRAPRWYVVGARRSKP